MNMLERAHFLHRAWRYRLRAERQEVSFLLGCNLRGATVVDVGAYRGTYSYWMHKKVGPDGNVVAFEPQPELCKYLEEVRAAFRLKRLTVVQAALSSTNGEQRLVRPHQNWGGASLEFEPTSETDCLRVRTTTLDTYFLESPLRPVRFVKCDVERHEHECFAGGERILREDRPTLLFESHDPDVEQVFGYLASLGFEGFFFHNRNLVSVSRWRTLRGSIPKSYLNYVFFPQGAGPGRQCCHGIQLTV